ncbi:MAG TPA: hypothetical protein VK837_14200 [Longimicrobiales bacterium]|nr:hypothetical protein [Longimicrobiales bacterium]
MSTQRAAVLSTACALAAIVACGDDSPTGPDYDPDIPTQWSELVTNPFFPLTPGLHKEFEGATEDGTETIVIDVLNTTRMVNGVEATIVRDQVFLDGELIEDTDDWYAQDADGNVWYLGEAAEDYEDGVLVSTDGSWEWGVDGALPGIIMWANPADHVGEEYRQEFYEGEAEDWAKVLRTGESVTVPDGSFMGCIVTEDWNGLEADSEEEKTYCAGIGVVKEVSLDSGESVELTAHSGS